MNKTQSLLLAVFSVFLIIGFGPVSPTCLIGFFIVLFRPVWFKQVTMSLYQDKPYVREEFAVSEQETKQARKHLFYGFLILFITDIMPIPVTAPIAIMIVLTRPEWFFRMMVRVYGPRINLAVMPSRG